MGSIGDLFFALRGDGRQLEVDAVRAGEAAGAAAGLQSAGSFAGRFRAAVLGPTFQTGLGAGIGVAAMGALGTAASSLSGTLSDAVRKAMEDEASVKRMTVAFRDSIPGWDDTTGAVERFITKSQDLAFTDDETRDSLTKLVSATKSSGKAMDLSRTAMDLARLRGIDLSTATDLVSKAYAGNIGALRRVLPWIDKNATATEALAAIQKAANGQAGEFADTTSGKMTRASIAIDEALEKLGYTLLPAVATGADLAAGTVNLLATAFDGLLVPIKAMDQAAHASAETLAESRDAGYQWQQMALSYLPPSLQAKAAIAGMEESLGSFSVSVKYAAINAGRAMPEQLQLGVDRSARIAAQLPGDIASAIRDKRKTWQDALATLSDDVANSMTRAQEIAKLEAALISKDMVDGLKSKDPVVKAQAEATAQIIVTRLGELNHLSVNWGESTGNAYADGLERAKVRVSQAAKGLSGIVRDEFQASSPPGPKSSLHLIDVWGERTGEAWAAGLRRGVSGVAAGLTAAAPVARGFATTIPAAMAAGAASSGGQPVCVHWDVDGQTIARVMDRRLSFLPRN